MLTAYAFLAAFFFASVLSIFRHPIFGLMAYVGTFYIHPPSRWWADGLPDLRWSLLAAAVTFAGLIVNKKSSSQQPILTSGVMIGMGIFIVWLAIQSSWALDQPMHSELLGYYAKFGLAAILVYKCVDSELHLKMFLWANVAGCFAFGWNAFFNYTGGRFESFGGPGFSDANFAGLHAVTGIFAASSLFLAGGLRERIAIAAVAPFIMNGLIATMSRSSSLAFFFGGISFIWFCPARYRAKVITLGIVAMVSLLALTNDMYWSRMETILFAGAEVEGVDTGGGRVETWQAQMEMFGEYPWGCGHRCTATLSPEYIEDRFLTGPEGSRARSSHNTFLTMLVEQGILGGLFYVLFLLWLGRMAGELKKRLTNSTGLLPSVLPGAVAVLVSIIVAEIFVDYLKVEIRIWYIAVLLVIANLNEGLGARSALPGPVKTAR